MAIRQIEEAVRTAQLRIGELVSRLIEADPAGAVIPFAGFRPPRGWLLCDGSTLNRADYPELFAAIGENYGGNGSTTFKIPNMGARVPVGRISGDADFGWMGKTGGSRTHTLTASQMPAHVHGQVVTANPGSGGPGIRRDWAEDTAGLSIYAQGVETLSAGGGQPHNNLQPYITVQYIIRAR